jgi:hypothetical protein
VIHVSLLVHATSRLQTSRSGTLALVRMWSMSRVGSASATLNPPPITKQPRLSVVNTVASTDSRRPKPPAISSEARP